LERAAEGQPTYAQDLVVREEARTEGRRASAEAPFVCGSWFCSTLPTSTRDVEAQTLSRW